MEAYAHLVASYLYPKSFRDAPGGGVTDDATAAGFVPRNDKRPRESCFHQVCKDFDHYYGSFITRHLLDLASLVAPFTRLSNSRLLGVLFSCDFNQAVERGRRLVRFAPQKYEEDEEEIPESSGEEVATIATSDESMLATILDILSEKPIELDGPVLEGMDWQDSDGDAIADPPMFSLAWTLAACGCYEVDSNFDPPPAAAKSLLESWLNQMAGSQEGKRIPDVIAAYYAWRQDPAFRSSAVQEIERYPYAERMPLLCNSRSASRWTG